MSIEKNKVVLLHYTLTDTTEQGDLIESTEGQDPLGFIYGIGSMMPEFEKQIHGLKVGDSFSFGIKAKDGYGEYDDKAVMEIPKSVFEIDGNAAEVLQVGNVVPLQDQGGNHFDGVVLEIGNEMVKMDFNHPMAGVDLWFKGKIDAVREANETELTHGHVHGHGGYDH